MKTSSLFKISGITAVITLIYIFSLIYVRRHDVIDHLDSNGFGDYIGGILNPIFTLLSTISIIYLTYYIANRDNEKANEALEIQKKVTLIQLRQNAYDSFNSKLNTCQLQFSDLGILEYKPGSFLQQTYTANRKDSINQDKIHLDWAIIITGIVNFNQQTHLFQELLENEKFDKKFTKLFKHVKDLRQQGLEYNFYTQKSSSDFLEIHEDVNKDIAEFILNKF